MRHLHELELGPYFLDMTVKAQTMTTIQIADFGLNQNEKLLCFKRYCQEHKKTTQIMVLNICSL